MKNKIKISHGIFCDMVRTETDNKLSLFGMFGKKAIFKEKFPLVIHQLAFTCLIDNPDQKNFTGKIVLSLPGLNDKVTHEFEITGQEGMTGNNINLTFVNMPIQEEGTISAQVIINSDPIVESIFSLDVVSTAK